MNSEKEEGPTDEGRLAGESGEAELEEWIPLSVRKAREARDRRDDLWPYVWMNFVSMVLLFAAAVIMAYRMGAQSCR